MLLRNAERRYLTLFNTKIWQTFYPADESSQARGGFASLLQLDEVQVPPAAPLPKVEAEEEIFMYVHRGVIAQRSASGSLVVQAGDFQGMATDSSPQEINASQTDWAHIFRLRLACDIPGEGHVKKATDRFTAAQRRNTLCMVASPDGACGSLRLRSDARIYSTVLALGHHFVHALRPERRVWLHMVCGRVTLDATCELYQGDGVGVSGAPSVSITAREDSEILLVDMGPASAHGRR